MTSEYRVPDWKPIQQLLNDLGLYAGLIDGKRGPLTDQAIVAFKRSIGFVARPFYGPLTHEALIGAFNTDLSPYPWYREAELVLEWGSRDGFGPFCSGLFDPLLEDPA